MTVPPTVEEIREEARHYALIWCPGVKWCDLSEAARGDFWTSAQMDLGVPSHAYLDIPEDEMNRE
jgi:hypothetical protein